MANLERDSNIFGWELFEGLDNPPVREEDVMSPDAAGGSFGMEKPGKSSRARAADKLSRRRTQHKRRRK